MSCTQWQNKFFESDPCVEPNIMNHDLALIELEDPLQFNDHLQPVCLPKVSSPEAGRQCFIAGWGMTTLESLTVQTHLMEAEITILADTICEKIFAPFGLWDSSWVKYNQGEFFYVYQIFFL